jgi:glucosamine kinase
VGTGVIGFQIENNHTSRVGGWGFPHDDQGGGAWLGLQAVSHTLSCYDGRLPETRLAKAVGDYFDTDMAALIQWANQANSSAFAELAPIVIHQAQSGESAATALMQRAARDIEQLNSALLSAQLNKQVKLPRALSGGISEFIKPYLSEACGNQFITKLAPADKGAIFMVKKQWQGMQR